MAQLDFFLFFHQGFFFVFFYLSIYFLVLGFWLPLVLEAFEFRRLFFLTFFYWIWFRSLVFYFFLDLGFFIFFLR